MEVAKRMVLIAIMLLCSSPSSCLMHTICFHCGLRHLGITRKRQISEITAAPNAAEDSLPDVSQGIAIDFHNLPTKAIGN